MVFRSLKKLDIKASEENTSLKLMEQIRNLEHKIRVLEFENTNLRNHVKELEADKP